ncbi:MAG: hypothetical protein K1X74_14030 [Pirellulales bacterium]|nr:hypothetical protein [Pirellulales bacterium]
MHLSDPHLEAGAAAGDLSEITVLIPAAGRVPEGVMALSNIACPAMVPVAGRPVIHWTLSYLRSLGLRRFIIAVARRGMFIEDFVEYTFGQDCEIRFLVPSRDGGLGLTVQELAEQAATRAALVVLGDTHFQFSDPAALAREEPFVLTSEVEESYRWCTAETDRQGYVTALHDKEPDLPGPLDALIGVYFFPAADRLRAAARDAVAAAELQRRPAAMADILAPLAKQSPLRAYRAADWLDCGNPDRQATSHRSLLQKRDFNELSIDPVLGTITKRSRHVEKFIDEINFLRLLPPELAVLFPRVIEFSTEWSEPWLKMEYYGYPSLSEVFVFENVDPGIWEQIFVHLREIVTQGFMRSSRPLAAGALREMCIGKTRRRLETMQGPPELLALVRSTGPVVVNGRPLANLPQLWDRLDAAVGALEANAVGNVTHGDLCFSNILYDLRSRICKLVDPRGSFGASGIYGDSRYDIAKLYHSVYGLYDFIVNDLFRVSVAGDEVRLEICARPQHTHIQERFAKVFFPTFNRHEILVLTGLLFASMPALHYDKPRRQLAMYTRALELFDEAFAGNIAPARPAERVASETATRKATGAHLH